MSERIDGGIPGYSGGYFGDEFKYCSAVLRLKAKTQTAAG